MYYHKYKLIRENIEYFIYFYDTYYYSGNIPYCFSVAIDKKVEPHLLSHLTPTIVKNLNENFSYYFSHHVEIQEKLLREFLKTTQEGDQLFYFKDDKGEANKVDNLNEFYDVLDKYSQKENVKKGADLASTLPIPTPSATRTASSPDNSPFFSRPSNRILRILGFVTFGLLTLALIAATVLTGGAAAGAVGLAGTAGFVGAMSNITGLSALSLSSVPAFMALASVAMGSFIASVFAFGSTLRMGTIHQGEDFHNAPLSLKTWFRILTPQTKVILAVGFGLLALGLLALGGWAIASIIGFLAVPAIVAPLLGSLAGGFLSTLGGVTTLLGVGFASGTLSGVAIKAAYDFSIQAKKDRSPLVVGPTKKDGSTVLVKPAVEWDKHPSLPTNKTLKGYLPMIKDTVNPSFKKPNRSLFEEIGDTLSSYTKASAYSPKII